MHVDKCNYFVLVVFGVPSLQEDELLSVTSAVECVGRQGETGEQVRETEQQNSRNTFAALNPCMYAGWNSFFVY
mgnify:CR=1 FL=1